MRIRKRFLSLSSAVKPPPVFDLPPVQQRQNPNGNLRFLYHNNNNNNSQPSDPPQPPSSDHNTQIPLPPSSTPFVFPQKKESEMKKKETIKNRKESILSAELSSDHLGDRLIPIKKRRGSFGKRVNHENEEYHNEMIEGITKPKENEITDEASATSPKKNKNKNGKRGNVIMEGSRCSRVNGRGWRCCQQTLVGYSLCEHHLGKGRLRSMNSIRGRAQKVAPKKQDKESEEEEAEDDYDEQDEDEEFNDWEDEDSLWSIEGKNKKKKLGVVKARSLSSLLSQTSS